MEDGLVSTQAAQQSIKDIDILGLRRVGHQITKVTISPQMKGGAHSKYKQSKKSSLEVMVSFSPKDSEQDQQRCDVIEAIQSRY